MKSKEKTPKESEAKSKALVFTMDANEPTDFNPKFESCSERKFAKDTLFDNCNLDWIFKSKFVRQAEKTQKEEIDTNNHASLILKQTQEILKKIEKEVQSQNHQRTKIAVLDFKDFEINDQNALLRSRSNTDFRKKCFSLKDRGETDGRVSSKNYEKFCKRLELYDPNSPLPCIFKQHDLLSSKINKTIERLKENQKFRK